MYSALLYDSMKSADQSLSNILELRTEHAGYCRQGLPLYDETHFSKPHAQEGVGFCRIHFTSRTVGEQLVPFRFPFDCQSPSCSLAFLSRQKRQLIKQKKRCTAARMKTYLYTVGTRSERKLTSEGKATDNDSWSSYMVMYKYSILFQ
jgi:hypothetical protein